MNEEQNTSASPSPQELCALSIGPRQTVRRVRHPQRGEGLVAYGHGPALFIPDGGDPVEMASADFGGWSAGPPSHAWTAIVDPQHGRVKATDLTRRESDPPTETHERMWSPLFGAGWLVLGAHRASRFEPDAGTAVHFELAGWEVGTLDYRQRSERKRRGRSSWEGLPMTDEEAQWMIYHTREAGSLAFRAAPPGEFPRKNDCPAPAKKTKAAKAPASLPGVR